MLNSPKEGAALISFRISLTFEKQPGGVMTRFKMTEVSRNNAIRSDRRTVQIARGALVTQSLLKRPH